MNLHSLQPLERPTRKSRVGRGIAAGQGKTAGRGTKGQKSRSGYNIPRKFEGGQTPLILRLPKVRGIKHFKKEVTLIDRSLINRHYSDGETVSPESLHAKKLISSFKNAIKIVGSTEITVNVSFEDVSQSKAK